MRISIEVEPIMLDCEYSQNDSSTHYYGFRVVGLPAMWGGGDLVVRAAQSAYPGNDIIRQFVNSRPQVKP